MKKKYFVMLAVVMAVVAMAGVAMAFNAGASGDVGYELYDLIVNKFIKGPIGAAGGTGLLVVGAVMAGLGKISGAAWPLVGGGILVSASALANSLGMTF